MGARSLAEKLECTKEEAQKMINNFFSTFPSEFISSISLLQRTGNKEKIGNCRSKIVYSSNEWRRGEEGICADSIGKKKTILIAWRSRISIETRKTIYQFHHSSSSFSASLFLINYVWGNSEWNIQEFHFSCRIENTRFVWKIEGCLLKLNRIKQSGCFRDGRTNCNASTRWDYCGSERLLSLNQIIDWFQIPKDEERRASEVIQNAMESAFPVCTVRLPVQISIGKSWAELKWKCLWLL